ncbi:MAG TPA: YbjN domain-containing protein [Pyrinomonadaceae bacterium]|jgi:hypothetical protein
MKSDNQDVIEEIAKVFRSLKIEHQVVGDAEDSELKIIQAALDINIKSEGEESSETRFPLTVMPINDAFGDLYVRFTITPFIEKESPELPEGIYRELAEINNRIPLLKFAVDGDNDIELVADLTTSAIDREAVEVTLRVMVDYVNMCFLYLLNLMDSAQAGDS